MYAYIDTNIFLDFYQSATDRLGVFTELVSRSSHIVLPQQTVAEFYRNRVQCLERLHENLNISGKQTLHTVAAIRELPEFRVWTTHSRDARSSAASIARIVKNWIDNPSEDTVLNAFNDLVSNAVPVPTTDELVQRAYRRKLLGQPPTTPDSYTIGDELNWESILSLPARDLVVVSRDRTFQKNQAILKAEYSRVTGGVLKFSRSRTSSGRRSTTCTDVWVGGLRRGFGQSAGTRKMLTSLPGALAGEVARTFGQNCGLNRMVAGFC